MSDLAQRLAGMPPKRVALLALELEARVRALEAATHEPIAIVGMSGRFPGADDLHAYWDLLRRGVDAVREVPADRWDIDALYDRDPEAPGKMSSRWGGFLRDIREFDPQFFGIAPREAALMDPQQRLLLEVTWEALEDAGIAGDRLDGADAAVFTGICSSEFSQLLAGRPSSTIDAYSASGSAYSIASGRVAYVLGIHGPALSIDTACSSSLVAVCMACEALRRGGARFALAGGVNVICHPRTTVALSKSRMMAADGRCKTFDAAADGFVRGEGCGVVVLKRLVDARADGDRILAVIRGFATNQDGRSGGLTAPNGAAQEALLRQTLADASLAGGDIDYVETHGTGTSLGDPIEVRALGAAMGEGRSPDRPLAIGSVKTNIGHLESAAGIAALIKVVLALRHGYLPPHLHFRTPNPHIDWANTPVSVTTSGREWPMGPRRRRAGVSSFGFSGTNAHVIVEEPPIDQASAAAEAHSTTTPAALVLPISARSDRALRALAGRYLTQLQAMAPGSPPALADLCYTAGIGRAHFTHRLAVVGDSAAGMATALAAHLADPGRRPAALQADSVVVSGVASADVRPEIGLLFTGQGAQYAGMTRALYEGWPVYRAAIDACAASLAAGGVLDRPLTEILFDSNDPAAIDRTEYAQPALFAVDYALARLWESFGIEPAAVLGHSLGEYVAACVAGVFSLDDALRLVASRGRLMQALPAGGAMQAIAADAARVRAAVSESGADVSIAAENGPTNTVISGSAPEVARVARLLEAQGVRSSALRVSHAFHSALIEPMLDAFAAVAEPVTFHEPRIALVSNLSGEVAAPSMVGAPAYWRAHARQPVRFAAGVRALVDGGCRILIEAGPHPVLAPLASAALGPDEAVIVTSLRRGEPDDRRLALAVASLYVHGAGIDWAGVHKRDADSPRRRVALPFYPFQRTVCWPDDLRPPRSLDAGVVADTGERWRDWLYRLQWTAAGTDGQRPLLTSAPPPSEWIAPVRARMAAIPSMPGVDGAARFESELERLATAYVVDGLRQLGFPFELDARIEVEAFRQRAGILPRHTRLLRRLMTILVEDGVLASAGFGVVRVARPPSEVTAAALAQELAPAWPAHGAELTLVSRCGSELAAALTGRVDPMELLYPGGSLALTEALYEQAPGFRLWNTAVAEAVRSFADAVGTAGAGRVVRVLELGAGTGSTASYVLPVLASETRVTSEYWFTDVSPLFVARARDKFAAFPFLRFGALDLEREPGPQGFEAGAFDLIVASNVVHATTDVGAVLERVRGLLAPGGVLILLEAVTPQRFGDITVGLTPGWWAYTDLDRRPDYALLTAAAWATALEAAGFGEVTTAPQGESGIDAAWATQRIIVARAPGAVARSTGANHWVLLAPAGADAEVFTVSVAEEIRAAGDECVIVTGRASADKDACDEALAAALRGHTGSWRLLDARAWRAPNEMSDADRVSPPAAENNVAAALALVQSALAVTVPPSEVLILTSGAESEGGLAPSPAAAAIWGLGRVIQLEHPELRCRLVDLQTPPARGWWRNVRGTPEDEGQLALRGNELLVRRLTRVVPGIERTGPLRFDGPGTFLVTGGLSGLGLRVARWMVERGARRLVLIGRHAPDAAAQSVIRVLEEAGAQVFAHQADVSDAAAMAAIVARHDVGEHRLRGVLHCAGTTADAAIVRQTRATLAAVMAAKVSGAWQLHTLTAGAPLEHFVLFSSGASTLGSPGQANHAAANAYMDALARWRRVRGLPGLSISWGAWSGLGAATRGSVLSDAESRGLAAIDPRQGLEVLDHLMRASAAHVAVLPIDWRIFPARFGNGGRQPLFGEVLASAEGGAAAAPSAAPAALGVRAKLDRLGPITGEARRLLVRELVTSEAGRILGLDTAAVPLREPLREAGLDSLMAVELRNALSDATGLRLEATLLFNYPTVEEVADYIERELEPLPAAADGVSAHAGTIDELTEEQLEALLAARLRLP